MSFIYIETCIFKLDALVSTLKQKLDEKQKEAAAWKAKYNIQTQEEAEASQRKGAWDTFEELPENNDTTLP